MSAAILQPSLQPSYYQLCFESWYLPFSFQTALFGSERNATIMSAEPLRPPPLLGATPNALPLRSGIASGSTGAPHQLEAEEDEGHGGSSSRGQQVAILPDSMSSYTSVLFPVVRKKGTR